MSAQKTTKWVDLSDYGLKLGVMAIPAGETSKNILILAKSADHNADGGNEALDAAGGALSFKRFERDQKAYWVYTDSTKFKPSEFVQKLKDAGLDNARIGDIPVSEVFFSLPTQAPKRAPVGADTVEKTAEKTQVKSGDNSASEKTAEKKQSLREERLQNQQREEAEVENILANSRVIGQNRNGNEVRVSAEGSRFYTEKNERRVTRLVFENPTDEANPSAFLRAKDAKSLSACADAFVQSLIDGEVKRAADFDLFVNTIYDAEVAPGSSQWNTVYFATQSSMARWMRRSSEKSFSQLFTDAVKIHENAFYQTEFLRHNQDRSLSDLPIPVSVAIHRILSSGQEFNDKKITVVNPGGGSLMSKLPRGTDISVFESRADVHEQSGLIAREIGLRSDAPIKQGQPDYTGADIVIANISSGWLEKSFALEGEHFSRSEFKEIANALSGRNQDGSAFFTFKLPNEEDVDEEFARFIKWVGRRYAVEGTAMLDGALHAGSTESPRLVVLSIGSKRPEILEEAPEAALRTKEIYDYPSLWTWTAETLKNRAKIIDYHKALLEGGDLDIDAEGTERSRNYYQAPYIPASKVGVAETMVPRHLESVTREALAKVARRHPDIDQWVANEVGKTKEEMEKIAAPEQIDAVALDAFAEEQNKKAFLLADMTGTGKGRTLALMALRQIMSGKKVMFITEKWPNIRDLFRDFRDIGALDMLAPFIINDNVKFDIDVEDRGTLQYRSMERDELQALINEVREEEGPGDPDAEDQEEARRIIREGVWPVDYNICFATYSQFSSEMPAADSADAAGLKAAKIRFLREAIDEDTCLILDESQNATGSSNTAGNISSAVARAGRVIYSSATHAKNAKTMRVYNPLFPDYLDEDEVLEIMTKGGENMQEVISSMLVKDGVMLRREHDNSKLRFETIADTKNFERNRNFVDSVSPILAELAYLAGDVNQRVQNRINQQNVAIDMAEAQLEHEERLGNRENVRARRANIAQMRRRIKSMRASKLNFGSPLFRVMKVMIASLKADTVADMAVQDIQNGRKPVIMVDRTVGDLMRRLYEQQEAEGREFSPPPDFKDFLKREIHNLTTTRTEVNGVVEERAIYHDDPALEQRINEIIQMVDQLPDRPVSVIDTIKNRARESGFNFSEITSRGFEYNGEKLVKRKKGNTVEVVDGFNNGDIHGVLINKSGLAGISLQAAAWFKNRQPRVMYELDPPTDINDQMQGYGRINRRGQVEDPTIITVDSGIPAEQRLIMVRNQKLRRQSATVTSNRENFALMDHVPDMINAVGDEVCSRYAQQRPELLRLLALEVEGFERMENENRNLGEQGVAEDEQDNRRSANQILARLGVLNCAMQVRTLEELQAEYDARIMELEAESRNPLKPKELKGAVVTQSKTIFEGAEVDDPKFVFDEPVYIEQCVVEQTREPIKSEELENLVMEGVDALGGEDGLVYADRLERLRMEKLRTVFEYVNRNGEYVSPEAALAAGAPELVNANRRLDEIIELTRQLQVGSMIRITGDDGEPCNAVVTRIDYPQRGFEHNAAKYRFKFVVPGDVEPRTFSFDPLLKNQHFRNENGGFYIWSGLNDEDYSRVEGILNQYENAGEFVARRRHQILTGNVFRAMKIAVENGNIGTMCVYYDKTLDTMRRGVVISGKVKNLNLAVPLAMQTPEMSIDALDENKGLTLYPDKERTSRIFMIKATRDRNSYEIHFPSRKNKKYGHILEDDFILGLYNRARAEMPADDNGPVKMVLRDRTQMLEFLRRVSYNCNIRFYADPKARTWANEWLARANMQDIDVEQENEAAVNAA